MSTLDDVDAYPGYPGDCPRVTGVPDVELIDVELFGPVPTVGDRYADNAFGDRRFGPRTVWTVRRVLRFGDGSAECVVWGTDVDAVIVVYPGDFGPSGLQRVE